MKKGLFPFFPGHGNSLTYRKTSIINFWGRDSEIIHLEGVQECSFIYIGDQKNIWKISTENGETCIEIRLKMIIIYCH